MGFSSVAKARLRQPVSVRGNTRWEVIRFVPENICEEISGAVGTGAWGLNNVCSLVGNRPYCECPQGFSMLDANDPNGDCKPDFTPSCDEGHGSGQFDFIELNGIDWAGSNYAHIRPSDERPPQKRSFVLKRE